MALTKLKTSGIADDAVTTDKLANAINTERTANTAKTSLENDSVTLAKMAGGTDGQIITYDASGDPVAVGPGTDGQVLTSTGAGSPPAFETLPTSGATLTGSTDNTICTVTGANAIAGEANLTYNGTRLDVKTGDLQVIGAEDGDAQLRLTADEGDDGADYWRLESKSSDNNFNLATYASGAWVDKLSMNTSGHLMLGTSTKGNSTADDLTVATTSNTGITIRSGTSNEGNIFFADGTSGADEYRGTIQYNHGSNFLTIGTDGSERMRIDSAGRVGINNTSMSSFNDGMDDLVIGNGVNGTSPGMTIYSNSSDIGSISFIDGANTNVVGLIQYRHLESSPHMRVMVENANIAKFTTDGICFGSDTASANALDDYEEGTWTPADSSGASLSITNNSTATYTKIGRLVHVQFDVSYPSNSSSFSASLSGIPYNQDLNYGSGVVGWTGLDNANGIHIHVGATAIFPMDNSTSNSSGSKHLRNDELSGIRMIGNATYYAAT